MAKYFLLCLAVIMVTLSCQKKELKDNEQFKIGRDFVGLINDSTQVKDLKFIFQNDSIVYNKEDDSFIGGINAYNIFEKNSNLLLRIFPNEALDSTSTIDFILIKDSRFKTEKGISILSTFNDIKNAYNISEFRNTLNSIELLINEIDATFVVNKNELLTTFDYGVEIDSTQLPKSLKFSSLQIHF